MKLFILLSVFGVILSCSSDKKIKMLNSENSIGSLNSIQKESVYTCGDACEKACEDIFFSADELNRCVELSHNQIRMIRRAKNKMRDGKWSAISVQEIKEMVKVSHSVWESFSGINEISSKDMLFWIVDNDDDEDERISEYLDSQGQILGNALDALSYRNNDAGVKEGLSQVVANSKTFLELAAWKEDEEAFTRTHQVILDVCNNDERCIEGIYCAQSSDIVFDMINDLDLAGDIVDSSSFNRGFCS